MVMKQTKEFDWIIKAVGIVFVLVGASKWIYDLLILDNVTRWRIYLIMIIAGVILAGYKQIGSGLVKIKLGRF